MGERFLGSQLRVRDILNLMDVALEEPEWGHENLFPYEVFEGLNALIHRTVHGTRVERFKPEGSSQPFHIFEAYTEEGESLGYLNMIYLRKPLPCYYLVYVEVLSYFRRRGLGQKILGAFKEFLEKEEAVGLLDNIIPADDPTCDIYSKLGWMDMETVIGKDVVNGERCYMVYIPAALASFDLKDRLIKLLFKVKKKRAIIDMHDNESMVRRTISEFRSVYETLEHLFEIELSAGISTPLMCFLFTKFVTKVLGFRRRMTTLLGYTGGESLEQLSISEQIKSLPIQPYSLWDSKERPAEIWGDEEMIKNLPEKIKREPTRSIEDLPYYQRPYLSSWFAQRREAGTIRFTIADILDLGFDPTRLREFRHDGVEHIFERTTPPFLASLERRRSLLPKIAKQTSGLRFCKVNIQINPPLVILRDKGNIYILRKKLEGIHVEEALDQLKTAPNLREMNRTLKIDQMIAVTIRGIVEEFQKMFDKGLRGEIEDLAFFIPWDIERNFPILNVDTTGVSLNTVWIA